MGNCAPKPKKPSPPPESKQPPATIQLLGNESSPETALIRLALLYKKASFHFVPSNSPLLSLPVLRCRTQTISGSSEFLLRHIDSRFPGSPSVAVDGRRSPAFEVRVFAAIQHRSIERHLEGVALWAAETAKGGGGGGRRAARRYAELVEVMLEHAQMEERLLFPLLERAAEDRGICTKAYEEHARELPMMNGIKEDMKSLMAMDAKTPCYHEALLNLSQRLKILQERCKKLFQEEEQELHPMLDTAERAAREVGNDEPRRWLEQAKAFMEATHSRLFTFFMAGLLPHEAMQYLHLVYSSTKDPQQLRLLLQSLVDSLEERDHHP